MMTKRVLFLRSLRGSLLATLAGLAPFANAQFTWDGGGDPDGNFTTAANWNPDVAPTSNGTFIFDGAVNVNATNDLTLTAADNALNFAAGASAFTVWGSVIRMGSVTNNSAFAQTVMPQLRLNGTRTIDVGTAGVILGTPLGSTGTGRTVNKFGAGALTLPGNATGSQVSYNINQGSMVFENTVGQTTSITAGNVILSSGTQLRFNNAGSVILGGITANSGSSVILNNGGSATPSGPVAINAGATLSGAGHLAGAVTVIGGISPGTSSIGTLSLGSLTLDPASTTTMDVDRSAGQNADLITVSGAIIYGGTLVVNNLGGAFQEGDTFDLVDAGSVTPSTFATLNLPTLDGSMQWNFDYATGVLSVVPVPEPASLALLFLAAGMLVAKRSGK